MALKLSDFRLERAVLEVRYPAAFLLWDRAGRTWHALREVYPDLKSVKAEPQVQQIRVNENFVSEIHFDRMNVQGFHLDNSIDEFAQVAATILDEAILNLEITDLARIGLRTFFERSFKTKTEMMEAGREIFPQFTRPTKKIMNIEDGAVAEQQVAFRLEGKTTGCFVRFLTQEQKLEIELPKEFGEVDIPNKTRNIAIIDVDYYAHAPTAISKFHPKTLVENWTRIVKRDLEAFVNG